MVIGTVYKACEIKIGTWELLVDLLPLDMYDFVVISGMDWL